MAAQIATVPGLCALHFSKSRLLFLKHCFAAVIGYIYKDGLNSIKGSNGYK
jgi:hypothetical protein